jgi:HEAT repeat protein
MPLVRRHALARLTALSFMLTAGTASAASLHELPPEVLTKLIDETESEEPGNPQRVRILSLLATDSRPIVRRHVAGAMGALWSEASEQVEHGLRRLARDEDAAVRHAAAMGLARALERASGPERIDVVCRWALSENVEDRAALARALTWPTPVFVSDLVIEQLARDASVEVRSAALIAAGKHFHEHSTTYARIVTGAASDPDRGVRRLARALLSRARA